MDDLFGFNHPTTLTGRKSRVSPGEKAERDKLRKRELRRMLAAQEGRKLKVRAPTGMGMSQAERRAKNIEAKRLRRIELAKKNGRKLSIRWIHEEHVKEWIDHIKRQDRLKLKVEKENLHDAHVREWKSDSSRRYSWKYNNNHDFQLKERLRTQTRKARKLFPKLDDLMRDAINRNGESKTVLSVCGYSVAELRSHIERQFTKGMNWNAFLDGLIHIDHIVPKSHFNLTSIDDVAKCWALPNLRPIWAQDNLRKANKRVFLI